jgi:hypothetical protein
MKTSREAFQDIETAIQITMLSAPAYAFMNELVLRVRCWKQGVARVTALGIKSRGPNCGCAGPFLLLLAPPRLAGNRRPRSYVFELNGHFYMRSSTMSLALLGLICISIRRSFSTLHSAHGVLARGCDAA